MVDAAASVEWIVASGEVDALMLEFNLIQQYLPRFNIRYRDDKSYPYLALTVGEKWPRAQVLRGTKRKKVRYFGPYGHAWAIRDTLDAMTRVFPIRTCTNHFFDQRARAGRPCLYYDIGRCSGPCVPEQTGITEEAYRRDVEALGDFLAGNSKPVLKRLDREMAEASDREEYEQAARFRDQLQAARRALESQEMVLVRPEALDVVGLAEDDLEAAFQVFTVRGGRVLGRKGWIVDRVEDLDRPELVASFLRQLYMEREDVPPRILVPIEPADRRGVGDLVVGTTRLVGHDRGPGSRCETQAHGGRRQQRHRRLPPSQAPSRLGLRRALPRALRARRPTRTRASPASDRVLRHLQPRADRHGRVDGGLRRRPAEAIRLSTVRDQERPRDRTISRAWRRCSHAGSRGSSRRRTRRPEAAGDSPILPRSSSWTGGGGS